MVKRSKTNVFEAIKNRRLAKPLGLSEQRRNETTENVINASKELFFAQGYDRTTTRQIAEAAGILNGSLFNIFPTKEDILKSVMVSIYSDALEEAEIYLKGNKDVIITIGYPAALELYAAYKEPRASELLFEAHSSWKVMNGLVDQSMDWIENRLNGFETDDEKERFRLDFILVAGCLGGLLSECYHGRPRGFDPALRSILKVVCALYELPMEDADSVNKKLGEIIRDGRTVISKFNFK
jgi:AcrR family transcriptional regulator